MSSHLSAGFSCSEILGQDNSAPVFRSKLTLPLLLVIVYTPRDRLGAKTLAEFTNLHAAVLNPTGRLSTTVLDTNTEDVKISPLAVKKRWNKTAIIDLYHSRKRGRATEYLTTPMTISACSGW
jgi:hypothetical protein